jgi:hypothetical protein
MRLQLRLNERRAETRHRFSERRRAFRRNRLLNRVPIANVIRLTGDDEPSDTAVR